MKKVKCKICGKEFDRERIDCVKMSNRYAHKECYTLYEKEISDMKKVTDLIQKLYEPESPNWNIIGSQLKRYRDEGMTYMGIYYSLTYFFVIQKNDIHQSKGIGIVPYIYNRAKAYYKNMNNTYTKIAQVENQGVDITQTENIVTIKQTPPKKKLIDFEY